MTLTVVGINLFIGPMQVQDCFYIYIALNEKWYLTEKLKI